MKWNRGLIILVCCSCQPPLEEIQIDPISKRFILENIINTSDGNQNAIFFMYADFCGMCTESVVKYINEFTLQDFETIVVLSDDSEVIRMLSIPEKNRRSFDLLDLEKHGLGFASSHLYLIEDTTIIYSNIVTEETFQIINQDMKNFSK